MRRIGSWWVALALVMGAAAPAAAVDHTVSLFIGDTADDSACDHGAQARVDLALQTNADGSGQVTASSVSACNGGSFGAPRALPENVGPIAMRAGENGFHVVEFALPSPLGELPDGAVLRFVIEGSNALDHTMTLAALPDTKGDPILFVVPAGAPPPPPAPINIPATGGAMLAALLLGIVVIVVVGKRHRRLLSVMLLGASAGLMAQVGGLRFDWSDGPLAGGDAPYPDAYVGVDALFVRADRTPALRFAFRLDLALQSEPVAVRVAGSPLTLHAGGTPGELTVTNLSTFASVADLWIEFPPAWGDVWLDTSDCWNVAPGASCALRIEPGDTLLAAEEFSITGANTLPVPATIAVEGSPVAILAVSGSPLQLIGNGPPGSIVVTNLPVSAHTATDIRATLPGSWDDVAQDASDCASLAPGASCTLTFTPGPIAHAAEVLAITGGNAQPVDISIEVTPPVPVLLAVTPDNGNTLGGTAVLLSGANLESASAVLVGSLQATITSVGGTQISAVTAPSPSHGWFDVTVVTPAGNLVLPRAFNYTIPTYTVGGTVSGLQGSLVLTNTINGDSLAVTADGPFTMPTRLQAGFGYIIVVGTQPAGQTCTVVNGHSFINAADSDDIEVDCASSPP